MPGPAVLHPYDPAWPGRAAQLLTALEEAFEPLGVAVSFEHIGFTSVPGLTAKAYIDLQVRVRELPQVAVLDQALAPTGFTPTTGSRPDSPGVYRDIPRGSEQLPSEVWSKRLFIYDIDGPEAAILHIPHRRAATPSGSATGCVRTLRPVTATATSRPAWPLSMPKIATMTTTPSPRPRSSIRCRRSSRHGAAAPDVGSPPARPGP